MPTLTLARSCFNLRAHSPPPPAPSPIPAVTPLMPSPRHHTRQSIKRKPVPSLVLNPTEQSSPLLSPSRPAASTLEPTEKPVHRARSQGVLRPAHAIDTPSLTTAASSRQPQIDSHRHSHLPLTPPSPRARHVRNGALRSGDSLPRPGTPPPTPATVRRRRDSSPPPPVPALPAGVVRSRHRPARLRTMTMVDASSPLLGRPIARISSTMRPGEREGDEPYWEFSILPDEDETFLDSPPDSPTMPVTPTTGSRNIGPAIASPRPRGGYFLPSPTANMGHSYAFESKYGASS